MKTHMGEQVGGTLGILRTKAQEGEERGKELLENKINQFYKFP